MSPKAGVKRRYPGDDVGVENSRLGLYSVNNKEYNQTERNSSKGREITTRKGRGWEYQLEIQLKKKNMKQ